MYLQLLGDDISIYYFLTLMAN